jgi:hypothetical protein
MKASIDRTYVRLILVILSIIPLRSEGYNAGIKKHFIKPSKIISVNEGHFFIEFEAAYFGHLVIVSKKKRPIYPVTIAIGERSLGNRVDTIPQEPCLVTNNKLFLAIPIQRE